MPSSRLVLEFFTLLCFKAPYTEDPFQGQTDILQAKSHQSILCGLSNIFHQYIDFCKLCQNCQQKEKNGRPDRTRPTFSSHQPYQRVHLQPWGSGSMCRCHFSVHWSEVKENPESALNKPPQNKKKKRKAMTREGNNNAEQIWVTPPSASSQVSHSGTRTAAFLVSHFLISRHGMVETITMARLILTTRRLCNEGAERKKKKSCDDAPGEKCKQL